MLARATRRSLDLRHWLRLRSDEDRSGSDVIRQVCVSKVFRQFRQRSATVSRAGWRGPQWRPAWFQAQKARCPTIFTTFPLSDARWFRTNAALDTCFGTSRPSRLSKRAHPSIPQTLIVRSRAGNLLAAELLNSRLIGESDSPVAWHKNRLDVASGH